MPPKKATASGPGAGGSNANMKDGSNVSNANTALLAFQQQQLQQQQELDHFINKNNANNNATLDDDDIRSFVLSAYISVAPSQHPVAQTAMMQSLDFVDRENRDNNNNYNNNDNSNSNKNPVQQQQQPLFIPECHTVSVEYYIPQTAFEALSKSASTAALAGTGGEPGNQNQNLAASLSKAQVAQLLAQQQNPISVVENPQALLINPNCLPALSAPGQGQGQQQQSNASDRPTTATPAAASASASSPAVAYDPTKDWVCVGKSDLVSPFSFLNPDQQQDYLVSSNYNFQNLQPGSNPQSSASAKNTISTPSSSSSKQQQQQQQQGKNINISYSNAQQQQQQQDGSAYPIINSGPILNSFPTSPSSCAPFKNQSFRSCLFQQKQVLIPAPNFVKDFLCGEFVAVLIISSPSDKDQAVQNAILNCGQPLPIVDQVRQHQLLLQQQQQQLQLQLQQQQQQQASGTAKSGKTSSSKVAVSTSSKKEATSATGGRQGLVDQNADDASASGPSSLGFSTYSFVFNFGPGFFKKEAELLSVVNPSVITASTLIASSSSPSSLRYSLFNAANTAQMLPNQQQQRDNGDAARQYENVGGIESFSLKLESDGNLLHGRNRRRFPVAFFDIQSMNDVPPPTLSLPPPRSTSTTGGTSGSGSNVIGNNNIFTSGGLHTPNFQNSNGNNYNSINNSGALDLRVNTLSPPTVATVVPPPPASMTLDSSRVHQALAQSNVAPPRIAFLWNTSATNGSISQSQQQSTSIFFTPRAKFSAADPTRKHNNGSRWVFNYSRPIYAPFGTSATEGRNGSAFGLIRQFWYSTIDFAIFDNERAITMPDVTPTASTVNKGAGAKNITKQIQQQQRHQHQHHSNLLQESLQLPSSPPSAFARLSLRDFVEIGATVVEEAVPVLPERPNNSGNTTDITALMIAAAKTRSASNNNKNLDLDQQQQHQQPQQRVNRVPHYVAFGTTLKCRVRLSAPLPFPVYVPAVPRNLLSTSPSASNQNNNYNFDNRNNNNNTALLQPSQVKKIIAPFENPTSSSSSSSSSTVPAPPCCFLTRIVLTLPYRSEMTRNVLRAVYSFLMKTAEKGNKTSDLFELPMLNESGTDFVEDHYLDTISVLARHRAQEALDSGAGGTGKGARGGGNAGHKAITANASSGAAAKPSSGSTGSAQHLQQQQQSASSFPSFTEKEVQAIHTAHRLEDSELAFHPFGNCYRRRIFVSVPSEVSGLELIDGDIRVVVIEAPCPIVAKIADLATEVAGPELHALRMLFNYELPFLRRDYHVWPPLVRPLAYAQPPPGAANLLNTTNKQQQPQQQQAGAAVPASSKATRGSSAERAITPTGAHSSSRKQHQQQQMATTTTTSKGSKQQPGSKKNVAATSSSSTQEGVSAENSSLQQKQLQNQSTSSSSPLHDDFAFQQQRLILMLGGGSNYSANAAATMEPLPDLDPGALGGRIRRVRLSCTLKSILQDPSQFLKRSLPSDAIEAALRLASLAGIRHNGVLPPETMLDALNRNMFPTQAAVVSLERACGDCLSTEDVCCDGDTWRPFSKDFDVDGFADSLARERIEKATNQIREQQLLQSHTKNMNAGKLPRVGTVLSFIGVPATAKDLGIVSSSLPSSAVNQQQQQQLQTRRFPPIDKVAQQYPKSRKSYVKVISASFNLASGSHSQSPNDAADAATTVSATTSGMSAGAICWPCVFPSGIVLSNQPIRFEITGQVVPARNNNNDNDNSNTVADSSSLPSLPYDPSLTNSILFVLDCKAYSAQGSDCRNPEFEKKKLQDKRIVSPKEYAKIMKKIVLAQEHEQQRQQESLSRSSNKKNKGILHQGDDGAGKNEALRLRASYETNRGTKTGNINDAVDGYSSSDGEDDSPPSSARNSGAGIRYLPISQKNWHMLTVQEIREKSNKNAESKDDQTMQQAAKYQRAAELYQKQEDQERAREEVIENLRKNLAHRPAFRSHQLKTAKDDNRHPKAPDEPLASRDQTPVPLAMRQDGVGGGGSGSGSASGALLLPPMKFLNASQALGSNSVYQQQAQKNQQQYSSGIISNETEDEIQEQRRRRLQKQQEEWSKNLVVDDPVFHVSTKKPRERPLLQLEAQTGSILHDEPKKKSVKMAFAPPPPISLRVGIIEEKKERVDPKVSKHPDVRQFIYTKTNLIDPLPKAAADVSDGEKVGPLWGK